MTYWLIKCKKIVAVVEADNVSDAIDNYSRDISANIADGYSIEMITDMVLTNYKYTVL